jgi:hypothetical protein
MSFGDLSFAEDICGNRQKHTQNAQRVKVQNHLAQ